MTGGAASPDAAAAAPTLASLTAPSPPLLPPPTLSLPAACTRRPLLPLPLLLLLLLPLRRRLRLHLCQHWGSCCTLFPAAVHIHQTYRMPQEAVRVQSLCNAPKEACTVGLTSWSVPVLPSRCTWAQQLRLAGQKTASLQLPHQMALLQGHQQIPWQKARHKIGSLREYQYNASLRASRKIASLQAHQQIASKLWVRRPLGDSNPDHVNQD